MKNNTSRRRFLRNTAFVTTGISLLSSSEITSAVIPSQDLEGYNPFAEEKTDLRTDKLFGDHLKVKGKIFDKNGIGMVSNASIEVWHLSPNGRKYRHRAKLKTNDRGEYEFITDYPGKAEGKSRKINFKVTAGHKSYTTGLLLSTVGAHIDSEHWKSNKQLGDKLLPKQKEEFGQKSIKFNFSI